VDIEEENNEPIWFAECFISILSMWESVLRRTYSEGHAYLKARAMIETIAADHVHEHEAEVAALVRLERQVSRRRAKRPLRSFTGEIVH
jgi:hypothetical protein